MNKRLARIRKKCGQVSKGHSDILKQKLEALVNILEATKLLEITGEGDEEQLEREAQLYSSLYEQRANVITKIQNMDEELAKFENVVPDKKISAKIAETAKAIVELDRKHLVDSEKLTAFLRGNIKKIRDGRDVSNAYGDHHTTSGYHFDKTN